MKLYMLAPDDPEMIVMRLADQPNGQMWIPRGSRFWADYEAWLAEGNQPDPWTPVVFQK